ncbi:MAG: hypothetical protein HOQ45_24620 [Nocardioidaceae bacterium]|nr:hypothetical protein [Nocardioidaceae bacterium]
MTDVDTGVPEQAVVRTQRARRKSRTGTALFVLLLLALPVVGGLLGLLVATITPPTYTAHAFVLITSTGDTTDVSAGDIAQATARVATSDSVLAEGDSSRRLLVAADDDRLTASASPDAPLVDLSASAATPAAAADLANALAAAVDAHVTSIGVDADVRASVFASASRPRRPTSPNPVVDVAAGVALGVLLAAVAFVLRRRERQPAGLR